MSGPVPGVLSALLLLAAVLLAALLLLNWWHRRGDAHAARLRQSLEPMLASWRERPPVPVELEWLSARSPRDGRTILTSLLAVVPVLEPEAGDRVRQALRRSGIAAREVARLNHRSGWRRAEACRIAGRVRDTGTIPLLVLRLDDRDPAVRREAIRALGDLKATEAVARIATTIEAMGEWSNLLLVMALVRMGPESAPQIGALLGASRSPAMSKALLQVIGRIGGGTDPVLIRALAAHPEPEVRVEAVRVLGVRGPDPESFAVCLHAMDDAEWPVRALAAWSLGRVGDERALPRLARAMGDPAYWVRHHVAEAMAALGQPGAAALRRGLEDANPFVRDMAAQALFMRALAEGEAA